MILKEAQVTKKESKNVCVRLLFFKMRKLRELQNDLTEFCSTTTIQGLRNVTDSKQNVVSRIVWMIVVVALFLCAGLSIKESIDGNNLIVF
jgi:hypothetical protein